MDILLELVRKVMAKTDVSHPVWDVARLLAVCAALVWVLRFAGADDLTRPTALALLLVGTWGLFLKRFVAEFVAPRFWYRALFVAGAVVLVGLVAFGVVR